MVPGPRPARLAWEQLRGAPTARSLGLDLWHGPHYTMPTRLPCPAIVTIHDLTFFDLPESPRTVEGDLLPARDPRQCSSHDTAGMRVAHHRRTARRGPAGPRAGVQWRATVSTTRASTRLPTKRAASATTRSCGRTESAGPSSRSSARSDPRKGLATLVGAFAAIAPDDPDLRLVIAGGDGWGAAELSHSIATDHMATRVIRTGYIPDEVVPALYPARHDRRLPVDRRGLRPAERRGVGLRGNARDHVGVSDGGARRRRRGARTAGIGARARGRHPRSAGPRDRRATRHDAARRSPPATRGRLAPTSTCGPIVPR